MVGLSGYFTAGIFMVLGLILIILLGRQYKMCYLAGGASIVLGVWWALNTIYPDHPIINGWVGWVVKIGVGCSLIPLAIDFFIVNKKERAKFKEEKEAAKAKEEEKRQSLYETYDDVKYEDEDLTDTNESDDSK